MSDNPKNSVHQTQDATMNKKSFAFLNKNKKIGIESKF